MPQAFLAIVTAFRSIRNCAAGRARRSSKRAFSKLPHEFLVLLFHDPEFGERVMTAGADFDDPKFLEAFVICDTHQLAMACKLLFPILSAVLATACLVNLQPRGGVISWRHTLRAVDNDGKQGMAIWNGRRRFL